ncbi:MAG: NAD(P)-dependent oxidoreductase [Aquabacterium sp.]|jgi:3-hydroxyisobutyrate dehydrogenase|uniref:NAD(P)-dependent oxidoreductase n=1 Tax=Aquabacterium sp. TaxID=1872578 RepID=UPI001B5F8740|nr:NAD(P)-dependent oxidoreductase [Aquabacterium sp.]MBP7131504.1 NAD(P)-dependent oxidoreductase [Aquabacterium sp.]MBP9062507.1 NAD(P)-dependent oxidoreductase [Aquabacterium sp.]MDQ5925750.1 3-hydroxyisobutyrate dehydrogenase [Pseudomonadota bacterium]
MNIADKTYDPTPARRIACIGLGTMGAPMAVHLQRAGHHVTVYNRTAAKATQWVQTHGGQCASTPREAAQSADIAITCVGNDDDLREVCTGPQGAFHSLAPGAVIVDHTTTSAEVARELAQAAREQGLHFIDAPVSGGNLGALNGVLTIMCGGDADAFARIEPVIAAYARAVTHLGDSGAGQLAKMVNQIAVAGLLQGLAEALAFGQKAGLDMPQVLNVISQGAASSWQMVNRGPTMIADQFDFGFAVDWMRKDLGLVLDEGRRLGARLPATALVDQFYADVQAMGGSRFDTSSLIKRLR